MSSAQGGQIRGVSRSSPMILKELRLMMLGTTQTIYMVLNGAIPQWRCPVLSMVLVERGVQVMAG